MMADHHRRDDDVGAAAGSSSSSSSPVRACLIAPSRQQRQQPATATSTTGTATRRRSRATPTPTSTSTSTSWPPWSSRNVDDAVRLAYEEARRTRDAERVRLFREALIDCRDGTIRSILSSSSGGGGTATMTKNGRRRNNTSGDGGEDARANGGGLRGRKRDAASSSSSSSSTHSIGDKKRRISNNGGANHNHYDDGWEEEEEKKEGEGQLENGKGGNGGIPDIGDATTRTTRQYGRRGKGGDGRKSSSVLSLVFPRLPTNDDRVRWASFAPHPSSRRERGCEGVPVENERGGGGREAASPPPPPDASTSDNNDRNDDDRDCALTISGPISLSATTSSASSTTTTTATSTVRLRPLPIEGCHPPRPKSSSSVFLRSILVVEDEPGLAYVPYFGDGDNEDIYSELFDTTERERLYEFGPKYAEEETLGTIDDVLRTLARDEPGSYFGDACALERMHLVLSKLADVDLERVKERHSLCFAREERNGKQSTDGDADGASPVKDRPMNVYSRKMNSDAPAAVPYESIMDSYRSLFCRQCFTYDCNTHGNLPKASLDLLGELAAQKEIDGHWKEVSVS